MAYKKLKLRISSVSPLILHNVQTADPLNDFAKAIKKISSKRGKTEDDYAEMARVEWYAGLYLKNGKPCLPSMVIEAAFVSGAKRNKRGKQALAGMYCTNDAPLEYEGPKDPDEMWKSGKFKLTVGVRVQNSRIMRTRPHFENWSAVIEIAYNPNILNEDEIWDTFKVVGDEIGLCDWRPKFGRFTVEKVK